MRGVRVPDFGGKDLGEDEMSEAAVADAGSGLVFPRREEHIARWRAVKSEFKRRGREAREDGISHRKYQVGIVVYAFSGWRWSLPEGHPEKEKAYKYWTGFNVKPLPGPTAPKACGEPMAVGSAIRARYDLAVALGIAAEPQIDDVSQVESKTLPPCHGCRTILRHLPIMRPWTIIFGMTPEEGGPEEEMTFEELLKVHNHIELGTLAVSVPATDDEQPK